MTVIFTTFKSYDSLDFFSFSSNSEDIHSSEPVYLAQALISISYSDTLGLEVSYVRMFCIKKTIDIAT